MRRVIQLALVLGLLTGVTAGIANGASNRVVVRCGHLYQPACAKPAIGPVLIAIKCHPVGTTVTIPAFSVKANAGLKTIVITLAGRHRPIATFTNLGSALTKRISGLKVNTTGLSSTAHVITIKVTDTRGKTATRTLRFAICPIPKPITTG